MTYYSTLRSAHGESDGLRRALVPLGTTVFVVTIGFTALGVFSHGPQTDPHSASEFYMVAAVVAAATLAIFGILLPRALRPDTVRSGGTALTMSVVGAALLVPAFWSGLPLVLGSAGAILGYAGRSARKGAGISTVAMVVGILASIGYVAIYVMDTLRQNGIG